MDNNTEDAQADELIDTWAFHGLRYSADDISRTIEDYDERYIQLKNQRQQIVDRLLCIAEHSPEYRYAFNDWRSIERTIQTFWDEWRSVINGVIVANKIDDRTPS